MQPPDVPCPVAGRLEQPDQNGHRADPAHRIVAHQYVVEKRRVHPLEQPDIEQEFPILPPRAGEEARLHPVLHEFLRPRGQSPLALSISLREILSANGQPADSDINAAS